MVLHSLYTPEFRFEGNIIFSLQISFDDTAYCNNFNAWLILSAAVVRDGMQTTAREGTI